MIYVLYSLGDVGHFFEMFIFITIIIIYLQQIKHVR